MPRARARSPTTSGRTRRRCSRRQPPLTADGIIPGVTRRFFTLALLAGAMAVPIAAPLRAADPIRYRFSFPEPQHRWMQVEATFTELPSAALELRMSRSSPGRYSLHDFAKNVYDVHATGSDGREPPTA